MTLLHTSFTHLLRIAWLGVWLSLATLSAAQAPGYQGKRLTLSVDPVAPLYQSGFYAHVDYVVSRQFAFSVIVQQGLREYTPRISFYKQEWGRFPAGSSGIRDVQVGVGLQYYFDPSIPAPQGGYVFAHYRQGLASAWGGLYEAGDLRPYDDFDVGGIQSQFVAVGVGNKTIFRDRWLFEFDFGLSAGNLYLPQDMEESVRLHIQSMSDRYGPNIHSFGALMDNGGFGFSGHVMLGFLLF